MTRYAVYWAPPADHPLWRAGCAWLGRDALAGGTPTTASPVCEALTDVPRRYGFHATLKAPIVLRDGAQEGDFLQAVRELARAWSAFAMPPLAVASLGDFLALRPVQSIAADHPLQRLADACVRDLDPWRAPPDDAERRRRSAGRDMPPPLQASLARWGYPHVFEHWRFHMTLSGPLPPDTASRDSLLHTARGFFAPALAQPLPCDALCVFVEPAPGAPFVLAHRFGFAA